MPSLKPCALYVMERAMPEICRILGRTPEQFKMEITQFPQDTCAIKVSVKNILTQAEKLAYVLDSNAFSFSMSGFNGCCGMCIAYHMSVCNPFSKKGIGTILEKCRIDIATMAGYSKIMATTIDSMQPEHCILEKLGWKRQPTCVYNNVRTKNTVNVWMYDTDANMASYANANIFPTRALNEQKVIIEKILNTGQFKFLFNPSPVVEAVTPKVDTVQVGPVTMSRPVQAIPTRVNSVGKSG